MIAFATNSLLCRAALRQTNIDAATFTSVRILSGALALWLIRRGLKAERPSGSSFTDGNWASALALFAYAAAFSFAYRDLAAGTGALLLFGAVQATMISWSFRKGERLQPMQIFGLFTALAGLVALVFPGISAPPLFASSVMIAAGIAWGIYSLRGKGFADPVAATTGNFLRAAPLAAAVSFILIPWMRIDISGIGYALISGAITSGLGYVIWYSVLSDTTPDRLGRTSAATVQLSVPVLAATGGILFLSEPITLRYLVASIAVLGGIALVVVEKSGKP